jgi:hypothetical protein
MATSQVRANGISKPERSGGGTMAIPKKSLISALKTAKKANIASAKAPVSDDVSAEALTTKNVRALRQMRAMRSAKNLRSAKANLRSFKSTK